jgi:hypothetical protein
MMKREYSGDITNKLENDAWHKYCVAPLLYELQQWYYNQCTIPHAPL